MKLKVYAVFDSKVGTYARPFFMQTRGEALRSWIDVISDKDTQFHRHPEDFCLFEVAEYDEDTGGFQNQVPPVSLGVALEYHPTTAEHRRAASISTQLQKS